MGYFIVENYYNSKTVEQKAMFTLYKVTVKLMFTLCEVKCEHKFYCHFVKCEHGFMFHSFAIIVAFNND